MLPTDTDKHVKLLTFTFIVEGLNSNVKLRKMDILNFVYSCLFGFSYYGMWFYFANMSSFAVNFRSWLTLSFSCSNWWGMIFFLNYCIFYLLIFDMVFHYFLSFDFYRVLRLWLPFLAEIYYIFLVPVLFTK